LTCFVRDSQLSSCDKSCPAGWLCQINNTHNSTLASLSLLTTTSATITTYNINSTKGTQIGLGGQCGGTGYNGSITCVFGLTCYIENSRYSQCLQSCPQYWQCQGNG